MEDLPGCLKDTVHATIQNHNHHLAALGQESQVRRFFIDCIYLFVFDIEFAFFVVDKILFSLMSSFNIRGNISKVTISTCCCAAT